ncbi:MAG: hypothetical protein LBD80_03245 [Tannerella sp.]|nr:hypothetical protein [Tannerella sp.]
MRKMTLFIAVILCCAACNNEIEVPQEPEETGRRLELSIPDAAEVAVYSAATVSECRIDTLWVCVFDGSTSAKKWVEVITGERIINNGQATQLLPQLKNKLENGDRIICIANTAQEPDTTSNLTLNTINDCFHTKPEKLFYRGGESLPMYGEIPSWSPAGAYTCRMIRAVAKVQVQLGASFSTNLPINFAQDVRWRIHNLSPAGFVQPKSTLTGFPGISNISMFAGSSRFLQYSGATAANTTLYIHEFQSSIHGITDTINPIDRNKWNGSRLCLMLVPEAPNGEHWRLEFYDHAKSEYLDMKRNHHYLFTINKVNSPPYTGGAVPAFSHPGSNLEYIIRVDDNMQYITSNGQYAIATSVDTVWISGDVTDQAVTTFRYINPTEVAIGGQVTVEDGTVQPANATLEITAPVTVYTDRSVVFISATNQTLRITTTGNLTEGVILFWVGNIYHRLHVKKRPSS